ncbi:heat-shock protein [Saccharobesus litoralis]|uniref:Heat-shock protein n=1 Tax=Saccharobesus litoralis TaxID=2172099 RepID=A0A2S0VUA6_9ALTE|nr:Hsp20 family protein [Saccharobesus litoralis]AWB67752.1 heat-shock protein [Saccharobesus litoralis]
MRNLDFTPLYRSFIGFDHLASMLDNASRQDKSAGYPPYNIELIDENHYKVSMAVAGFTEEQLEIRVENNHLIVAGKKPEQQEDKQYLYKGISERNFERKFQLGDHVKVIGADLENGLLHIDLEREIPEALKPKTIAINAKNRTLDVKE